MSVTGQIAELELEHPGGRLRLNVPADVAVGELLGDFLDVAGLPDSDGWALRLADGRRCDGELTLAQLGMPRAIVLYDFSERGPHTPRGLASDRAEAEFTTGEHTPGSNGSVVPSSPGSSQIASAATSERAYDRPARAPRRPGDGSDGGAGVQTAAARGDGAAGRSSGAIRPVRTRTEELLPDRVRLCVRVREALAALRSSWDARDAQALGVNDPDMFTKAAKRPVRARVRDAWWGTDYVRLLEASVLMPHPRCCQTIAVASPKGGVGKTVITALLGSLLSFIRRDRVVAVDTNPDWGSLGRRLVPEHRVFIDELLAGPLAAEHTSPMDLAVHLGHGPDGLLVAPAPTEQARARKLDEAAYGRLFSRLAELAEVLVLDCGTGLDSPAARAALAVADQVVLVTDGQPDTASLVAEAACEQLRILDKPLFLVANMITSRSRVELGALERKVSFARGIVDVPHDQSGADSLQRSRFSWQRETPTNWRVPLRELSALIAIEWSQS